MSGRSNHCPRISFPLFRNSSVHSLPGTQFPLPCELIPAQKSAFRALIIFCRRGALPHVLFCEQRRNHCSRVAVFFPGPGCLHYRFYPNFHISRGRPESFRDLSSPISNPSGSPPVNTRGSTCPDGHGRPCSWKPPDRKEMYRGSSPTGYRLRHHHKCPPPG